MTTNGMHVKRKQSTLSAPMCMCVVHPDILIIDIASDTQLILTKQ